MAYDFLLDMQSKSGAFIWNIDEDGEYSPSSSMFQINAPDLDCISKRKSYAIRRQLQFALINALS